MTKKQHVTINITYKYIEKLCLYYSQSFFFKQTSVGAAAF